MRLGPAQQELQLELILLREGLCLVHEGVDLIDGKSIVLGGVLVVMSHQVDDSDVGECVLIAGIFLECLVVLF